MTEVENFELRMGGEERERRKLGVGNSRGAGLLGWRKQDGWILEILKLKLVKRYFICPVGSDGERVDDGDIDGDGIGGGDNCVFYH